MKRIIFTILIVALLIPGSLAAQKRKKTAAKPKPKPKVEVVVEEEDPRIAQMLEATQQIVFIDSMVVGLDDFVRHIPLSTECGRLAQTGQFGQYTNELGDKRFEAIADAQKKTFIYVRDMMGYSWGDPVKVNGLGTDEANYPYMMPDGTTLYFAQKGEASIGGYDLFVTRYDAEDGAFLKPENLGMPFSSESNDYLFAIDEQHQLGYFVTDRRQPQGKVCIYVFIPNEVRRVYQSEAYEDETLRSLARLDRMADTWNKSNAAARQAALQRLKEARSSLAGRPADKHEAPSQLDEMRHKAEVIEKALRLARNNYAASTPAQRDRLRPEILQSEQELEQLQRDIRQKEKEERNKKYQ